MQRVVQQFILALGVGGLLAASATANIPRFELRTIHPALNPEAVNVDGTVVGLTYDGVLAKPAVWSASNGLKQLPAVPTGSGGSFSFGAAFAINDQGLIGGTSGDSGNEFRRATLWPANGSTPITLATGGSSSPRDIVNGLNESGMAAGLVATDSTRPSQAALWDANGTLRLLRDPTAPTGTTTRDTFATDVNAAGEAVGAVTRLVDGRPVRAPVRWTSDSNPIELPQPAGVGTLGVAQDLNDAGLVAGNNTGRMLLWNASNALVPLALPSGITQTRAEALFPSLDEAGRLLGGVAGTGGPLATLWLDPLAGERGILLNDLLSDNVTGWTLDQGIDIASDEELLRIVAYGTNPAVNAGQRTPVLLTADLLDRLGGDANNDGTVSLADFLILRSNFGTSGGATFATGDFNFDGTVSLADFLILRSNFGTSAGSPPTPAMIPEPATLSFVSLAGLALLRRRR